MFYLYVLEKKSSGYEFRQSRATSLAGSKSGLIARYLQEVAPKTANEPFKWHIDVGEALRTLKYEGGPNSFVIDANPNGKQVQLFLLRDIWGYSACDWTPIMLRMRLLTEDIIDKARFTLIRIPEEDVFTFLYLRGSVKNGKLEGRWLPPGPSPTNSVFLWPDALEYFMKQAGYVRTSQNSG